MNQLDKAFMIAETLYYETDYGKQTIGMSRIEEYIGKMVGTDLRTVNRYKLLLSGHGFIEFEEEDKYRVPKPTKPLTPTEWRNKAKNEAEQRKQAKKKE